MTASYRLVATPLKPGLGAAELAADASDGTGDAIYLAACDLARKAGIDLEDG